jgi:carbamoyl-phosphate synthase large subunit
MKVMITGAGSVMGYSIFQALNYMKNIKDVEVVFTNSNDLGAGFYFNLKNMYPIKIIATEIVPLATDSNYEQFIIDLCLKHQVDFIFSGTQHELYKVSKLKKEAKKTGTLNQELLDTLLDKYLTHELLDNSVVMPKSFVFGTENKRELVFPLVIKPRTDSSSRNIYIVNNLKDYENLLLKIEQSNRYIVQEFIEGKEYTCGCYIDRYSKKVSSIIMERELTKDGATGWGKVIFNEIIANYINQIASVLLNNGMEYGHVNIQLRMRNNQPYCFEINPRLSSTEGPKAQMGFNSVEAYLVNTILEKEYLELFPIQKQFLRYYEDVIF